MKPVRAAFASLSLAGLLGCGYHQTPELALVDSPAASRAGSPVLAEGPEAPRQVTVRVGPAHMEVPIAIQWTIGRDAAGCAHVQHVTARRVGGSPGVEITATRARTEPDGCVSLLNGPPGRFDSVDVLIEWRARRGIKSFTSSGHVVVLHGNGTSDGGDDVTP